MTIGVSADGITQYANDIIFNPYQKGQFVQWATADGHPSVYWGGAYRDSLITNWLLFVGLLTNGGSVEILGEVLVNEQDNQWWDPIRFVPEYGENIQFPTIHLGAWWDIFCDGTLDAHEAFSTFGAEEFRDEHHLFMEPMGHCSLTGEGLLYPNSVDGIAASYLLSFEKFAGQTSGPAHDAVDMVNLYVMGSPPKFFDLFAPGNYWTSIPAMPTPRPETWYMHPRAGGGNADGVLLPTMVTNRDTRSYRFDPTDPIPTFGGNNLFAMPCGPQDIKDVVEVRSDIVSFTTAPLQGNYALTGKLTAKLYVSSTARDTDFMVWVTDVWPNNQHSVLLRYGAQRMRWRGDRSEEPLMMEPGEVYEIDVDLWSTSYIINSGHSIRVTIGSSNAPHYSVNPNNGNFIVDEGEPVVAENTVHFAADYPSSITLPVVSESDLPRNLKLETLLRGEAAETKAAARE